MGDKTNGTNVTSVGGTDCKHCLTQATIEGHDGCLLGSLPGVMNACCGHGDIDCASVQLYHEDYKHDSNKYSLHGKEAMDLLVILRKIYIETPARQLKELNKRKEIVRKR